MVQQDSSVSVIVCAYTEERWEDLVAALASVQDQTLPADQIILVVDHDPILLERARGRFDGVTTIANTRARGLPGARNSGIEIAHGRYLAFLDDDARADPAWLQHLLAPLADDRVLGVGGRIEPVWADTAPGWFPDEFLWVVGCTYLGSPTMRSPIRNMIGANMAFRRSVFEGVGGFREELGRIGTRPVGCEETEMCIRAGRRWPERTFLYEPSALVLHRQPASRATWRYFFARCYAEGLSKAAVSRLVGSRDGLASERDYTLRVLPVGALRGVRDAVFHRDATGFARAFAIMTGFVITGMGYASGLARQSRGGVMKPPSLR